MSRYLTSESKLSSVHPTVLDSEFLDQTDDAIRALMYSGYPDVASVASHLSMHPAKLRRRLKAITGLRAGEYICVVRLRRALFMLDEWPRYTITQTGQLCGFADNAHFNHVFHRWMDMSPSDYVAGKTGSNDTVPGI